VGCVGKQSKARNAVSAGIVDLYPRDALEVALDIAVRAAKQLDVRTHSERIDKVIDAAIAAGVTTVTSFTLLDWQGLIAGLLSYAVADRINVGEFVARAWFERRQRLRDLAEAEPGRVQRLNDDGRGPAT
jgi:hypothetical protein